MYIYATFMCADIYTSFFSYYNDIEYIRSSGRVYPMENKSDCVSTRARAMKAMRF